MGRKYTTQEALASKVSKAVNKRVGWCTNQDGSLDIYNPEFKVVFTVTLYRSLTWRPAGTAHCPRPIGPTLEQEAFAKRILNKFLAVPL